eukprot:m.804179 g.804179  ORF g.804179 m.804179 type:complete len:58 (-) comp23368_c0_seq14:981-1154(-)
MCVHRESLMPEHFRTLKCIITPPQSGSKLSHLHTADAALVVHAGYGADVGDARVPCA